MAKQLVATQRRVVDFDTKAANCAQMVNLCVSVVKKIKIIIKGQQINLTVTN